jgi:hypothetical protein
MKLKALVAAMALAAGVAHATYPTFTDTTAPSKLDFSLWNASNGVSAMFDLGLNTNTFSFANVGGAACTAGCAVDKQITWNFNTGTVTSTGATDLSALLTGVSGSWASAWNTYSSVASGNVQGSLFDVFSAKRAGTTTAQQHVWSTSGTGTASASNGQLLAATGSSFTNWYASQAVPGAANVTNHASVANGANVALSSAGQYQGVNGGLQTNWNGKLPNVTATGAVGSSMDFFALDGVAGTSTAQAAVTDYNGQFALDAAAGTLTWTTLAAVPEPSTYAMLFAGLGMIGLMARRRAR